MASTLIIGYGNPLRGDDSLGLQLADRLATAVQNQSIEILALHQLTPELAELISKAELVIFADASHAGPPGSWNCEIIEPNAAQTHSLTHHFTPLNLLAYARAVFGACPPALLVSVAGESFGLGEDLTPSVEAALPGIVQYVREEIANRTRAPEAILCMSFPS